MKKHEIRTIEDPNDILDEINNSPSKISKHSRLGGLKKNEKNSTFGSGFGIGVGNNKVLDEARLYD